MAVIRTKRLWNASLAPGGAPLSEPEADPAPMAVPPNAPTADPRWTTGVTVYTCPPGKRAIIRHVTGVVFGTVGSPAPAMQLRLKVNGPEWGFFFWSFAGVETGFMSTTYSFWTDLMVVIHAGEKVIASVASPNYIDCFGSGHELPEVS